MVDTPNLKKILIYAAALWVGGYALGSLARVIIGTSHTAVAQDTIIDEPRPRSQSINVYVPYQKLAVDLEVVDGKFYVLWNDGSVTAVSEPKTCPADLNGNGVVDVPDLQMLQAAWGDCPK